MSVEKVAKEFTEALRTGEFAKAESFWADDVVSLEARAGEGAEVRGKAAAHAKGEWWTANHEVHAFEAHGPYINRDQFALRFKIDVTQKQSGQRIQMEEVGLYTVKGDKISEERFFY